MKKATIISGNKCDWDLYHNQTSQEKNKIYFENQVNNVGNDSKKVWKVLNNLTGRKNKDNPSFLEAEDKFITKPVEIANHLNDYFIGKLDK